tara:strand:+ start:196 stop:1599 length:1404 start_codon:yes stop_codon:yes gene_type:complete
VQGKILVVDSLATNRIVLKVKLQAAFYDVLYAHTVAEALDRVAVDSPDLVICAMNLPDGTAARFCHRLKQEFGPNHVPVMAITRDPSRADRIATLKAGARDVLTWLPDETLLLGRARSLIRAHVAASEWHLREDTTRALGLAEPGAGFADQAHCMLVCADRTLLRSCAMQMRPTLRMKLSLADPGDVMRQLEGSTVPDVFVLVLPRDTGEAVVALRFVSALRANAATRHAGILVLQTQPDTGVSANALDMGADDLMTDGFDLAELSLRLRTVIRRIRMAEQLRRTVRTGLQAAVFDPLTGLHNRRYAMPHLARTADHAGATDRDFAVLAADLDHFKQINDLYGHAAGDAVLVEVAARLRRCLRPSDLAARIGGEEFLIVMPGTSLDEAQTAALRICDAISRQPFDVPGTATPIDVTISIGMAVSTASDGAACRRAGKGDELLARADRALYAAKDRGRNQVTLGRPAA